METTLLKDSLQLKRLPRQSVPRSHKIPVEGCRPRVAGKFLFSGQRKIYLRGITYGPFRPNEKGESFDSSRVARDFTQMASVGINAVRVYTVPPRWFLDKAQQNGIWVMVGLAWEQHITFLDQRESVENIKNNVRDHVRSCAGHPAVLCFTIGNEIPPSIVRWYGRKKIEGFLKSLYRVVKSEDPEALVTYINFPTTEYLNLTFLDFMCFNVYLESEANYREYLARLQSISGDKPLVMAEVGLDSLRNGREKQAEMLEWQIRAAFAEGVAGLFVFAWTDEWYRGGNEILDWDFGVTDRNRQPKPALQSLERAFSEIPFAQNRDWPKITVVVCTYNGSRTIRECCEGLLNVIYPNLEVVVVNDGSTDNTESIVKPFGFRMISTTNHGLSSARNTGLYAATGKIVVYLDDDAAPDPHWLKYIAATFQQGSYGAVGGPNLAPAGDGLIADSVANAPGGPCHVLLSDREAEHIPGCNMAFDREVLKSVGGFDPLYRTAGDDVDVCWRVQHAGYRIGFSHAALVWHHRRNSVKTYWKQQKGYGKAEGMLERKWPEKYNVLGHLFWSGRIYGKGQTLPLGFRRWHVYHGVWGSALFQSLYQAAPSTLLSVPLMPEWYLLVGMFSTLTVIGLTWTPLLVGGGLLLALSLAATMVQAVLSASKAVFTTPTRSRWVQFKLYALTSVLHILQPLARLTGRLTCGLTPWRIQHHLKFFIPRTRIVSAWSETYRPHWEILRTLESVVQAHRAMVLKGHAHHRWDLEIWGGMFGGIRLYLAIEEHGGGKQMMRFRLVPRCSKVCSMIVPLFAGLSLLAGISSSFVACFVLGAIAWLFVQRTLIECAGISGLVQEIIERQSKEFSEVR